MRTFLNLNNLESVEEIKSAELKEAHTKRLPGILRGDGVAKVTRYGKTEYFVVSPSVIKGLVKRGQGKASSLDKLKARYKKAQVSMQTRSYIEAFDGLAHASSEELNASVKVGSH